MEFLTPTARENYRALVAHRLGLQALVPGKRPDRDIAAALYVLAHIGKPERFLPHIDTCRVSFDRIMAWTATQGSGLTAMGRLAAHLYNPLVEGRDITPWETFRSLDSTNTQIAFNALRIAYDTQYSLDDRLPGEWHRTKTNRGGRKL